MDRDRVDDIIERALAARDVPSPPPHFTAGVMALVIRERWRAERALDIGFNVAVAAGVLIILAGAAGLAWSFGLLTVAVDVDQILALARAQMRPADLADVHTVLVAAIILTIALGLWWWAEADSI
jgi:hypothetical protein